MRSHTRWDGIAGVALAAAAAMVLAGCTAGSNDSPPEDNGDDSSSGPITALQGSSEGQSWDVAFVAGMNTDPFFITIRNGIEAEAERLGVELNLSFQGSAAFDQALQIPLLDSVLATEPDFLIVAPVNAEALSPSLMKFTDAGIPVITIDGDVTDKSARLGWVATDNGGGGRLAAQWMSENVGSGEVIYLGPEPGVSVFEQRESGFVNEVQKHDSLELVGTFYNKQQRDVIVSQVASILQQHPDLAAIYASTNEEALSAAVAVKNAGLIDQVSIVGFDADPAMQQELDSGAIDALIAQNAFQMGQTAMNYAARHLAGNPFTPAVTQFEPVLVTSENKDDPAVRSALYSTE